MPIILGVNHESREVDAVAIGQVSCADVENHLLAERHFGGLAYKEFIDARAAAINWTSAEVQQIVDLVNSLGRQSRLGPTAVLVCNDVAFGMIRALEALLEGTAEVKPFRLEQEARAWLSGKAPVG
jgi:hypothetical protein